MKKIHWTDQYDSLTLSAVQGVFAEAPSQYHIEFESKSESPLVEGF